MEETGARRRSPGRKAAGAALLLLTMAFTLHLAHAAPAPTILVFGDSISAAYGMRVEEGWVALLRKKLFDEGYGWRVVNASVSGETTAGGRERLPRALELHRPKVVILELGANDGLRGLPPLEMSANLEAMITAAQAAGAAVLMIRMPLPTNYGAPYTERFGTVFTDLAGRYRLALVPFHLQEIEGTGLLQEDRLHPGVRAQPLLLAKVWPALRKAIEKTKPE